jgi:hypothetical protein
MLVILLKQSISRAAFFIFFFSHCLSSSQSRASEVQPFLSSLSSNACHSPQAEHQKVSLSLSSLYPNACHPPQAEHQKV